MGSRVYARRCRERGENIVAMLSLETIGYYDDRPGSQKYPPPFGLLYPSAGNFIGFVGNLRQPSGAPGGRRHSGKASHSLRRGCLAGSNCPHRRLRPRIVLARRLSGPDGDRHGELPVSVLPQAEDTIDKVDFDRLARVVRGLEKVVEALVGVAQAVSPPP